MTYTTKSKINSVDDVKVFFKHLLYDRKVNFHPDEDFANYVSSNTHKPSFSRNEVPLYNRLMSESFDVCSKVDEELIYKIGAKGLWEYHGWEYHE